MSLAKAPQRPGEGYSHQGEWKLALRRGAGEGGADTAAERRAIKRKTVGEGISKASRALSPQESLGSGETVGEGVRSTKKEERGGK